MEEELCLFIIELFDLERNLAIPRHEIIDAFNRRYSNDWSGLGKKEEFLSGAKTIIDKYSQVERRSSPFNFVREWKDE